MILSAGDDIRSVFKSAGIGALTGGTLGQIQGAVKYLRELRDFNARYPTRTLEGLASQYEENLPQLKELGKPIKANPLERLSRIQFVHELATNKAYSDYMSREYGMLSKFEKGSFVYKIVPGQGDHVKFPVKGINQWKHCLHSHFKAGTFPSSYRGIDPLAPIMVECDLGMLKHLEIYDFRGSFAIYNIPDNAWYGFKAIGEYRTKLKYWILY